MRKRRKELLRVVFFSALVAGALILPGCGQGLVGPMEDQVASVRLVADPLGALQFQECLTQKGARGCVRYPNTYLCDQMNIQVDGLANLVAFCQTTEKKILLGDAEQEIPLVCKKGEDGCVRCMDIFGSSLINSCKSNTILFDVDESLDEGDSDNGSVDQAPGGCDPGAALEAYADEFNRLLEKEGLCVRYQPDGEKAYDSVLLSKWQSIQENKNLSCTNMWWEMEQMDGFGTPGDQRYCQMRYSEMLGGERTFCICSTLSKIAYEESCKKLTAQCDPGLWQATLWTEMGAASQWLSSGSYGSPDESGDGSTDASGGTEDGSGSPDESGGSSTDDGSGTDDGYGNPDEGGTADGDGDGSTDGQDEACDDEIVCQGCPLVLDLDNDGPELTSVKDGVRFSLFGYAPTQTAWVSKDDALLAMDRNQNGKVDDGTELFGEAEGLDGFPAANGFEALALVDQPRHGGNGNGVVDRGDNLFGLIRIWKDTNRDGVSQPAELMTLSQAKIQELNIRSKSSLKKRDKNDNSLGGQSRFVRSNGRKGTMTDVWLVFGQPK